MQSATPWLWPGPSFFFVTGDSATHDGVHHGVGMMLHVNPHLGMLHECAGGVHCAEGGLLAEDEYINGVLRDDALLCSAQNC